MKCFDAAIGYLPDIIPFPFLCGISPFIGTILLNINTSSNSEIALSILLFLINLQIAIEYFFETGTLTPFTTTIYFLFFIHSICLSFFFSFCWGILFFCHFYFLLLCLVPFVAPTPDLECCIFALVGANSPNT